MMERPDSKKLYKRWRSMTVAAFASWHVYTILFWLRSRNIYLDSSQFDIIWDDWTK